MTLIDRKLYLSLSPCDKTGIRQDLVLALTTMTFCPLVLCSPTSLFCPHPPPSCSKGSKTLHVPHSSQSWGHGAHLCARIPGRIGRGKCMGRQDRFESVCMMFVFDVFTIYDQGHLLLIANIYALDVSAMSVVRGQSYSACIEHERGSK